MMPAFKSFVILAALAVGPTACATNSGSNADPVAKFEAACTSYSVAHGDAEGVKACSAIAERLRERRAAIRTESRPGGAIAFMPERSYPPGPQTTTITVTALGGDKVVEIGVKGPIVPGDFAGLGKALRAAASRYPSAHEFLALDSPGGSLSEAAKIAAGVRRSGMPVAVLPHAMCASACFLIFASARAKIASRSAKIGVHSVVDATTDTEDARARAVTAKLAMAWAQIGVPPEIIGLMAATPPGEIAWLSQRELASMGVRFPPASADH